MVVLVQQDKNKKMNQYLDLLQNILDNGVEKQSARPNLPNTIGISSSNIKMDLSDGFPLLTTKKMYWKGIVHELLWFLRGETNIKYLVDNKVNIWNPDAYRWYLKFTETMIEPDYDYCVDDPSQNKTRVFTKEEFIEQIRKGFLGDDHNYKLGDLGKIYGYQWRNQNGVDQVKEVIDGLKTNPYSRYHIIDGWNKADFSDMALPPCHLLYQFIVRPLNVHERENWYSEREGYSETERMEMFPNFTDKDVHAVLNEEGVPEFYLDLNMYQRSVDFSLGASFNLASMSLMLMIFAKTTGMIAGIANWIGGDTHIYIPHIPKAKEQLTRIPKKLPQMIINKNLNSLNDIENLNIDDFNLVEYVSYPTIKYDLFVGLKK